MMYNRNRKVEFLFTFFILILPIYPFVQALSYHQGTSLANVDASFIGEQEDSEAGFAVDGHGDFNGDGYSDFIIGAPFDNEHGNRTGQSYLIFGKKNGWMMDQDLTNADASFYGENIDALSGMTVASAGDVNGDGFDDILIGSFSDRDATGGATAKIYLFFGKSDGWSRDTNLSTATVIFSFDKITYGYPPALSTAGDINGDGFNDVIIGVGYNIDEDHCSKGITFVVFGKKDDWSRNYSLLDADTSFIGESCNDSAGVSVGGSGDVNGDGFDDFLINTPYDREEKRCAGKTYLIFGKQSGWKWNVSLSESDASFIGENAWDFSGHSISGAGDVNGDSFSDLIIGASFNDYGDDESGQVYLIFGKEEGWRQNMNLSNSDASFFGKTQTHIGESVDGAGDVNGDGYDDLILRGGLKTFLFLGHQDNWSMRTDVESADASFLFENWSGDPGLGRTIAGVGDVNGDGHDDILIGDASNNESGYDAGQTYLIFPDINVQPNPIDCIKVFSDVNYSQEITDAWVNQTLFIELKGKDNNQSNVNVALIKAYYKEELNDTVQIRLYETDLNTGIYRGVLDLKNKTDLDDGWIIANPGAQLTLESVTDSTKKALVSIKRIVLMPLVDRENAKEDDEYKVHYWAENGTVAEWFLQTNASWLSWNAMDQEIIGTPDNRQVGPFRVRIGFRDIFGTILEHNFEVMVENVPPKILSNDIETTVQDKGYENDYTSDDDGQGVISWGLATNSTWLALNSSTGVLFGTPSNDDVGYYWVNVTVDDGNGGRDWSNFTLTVQDMNDPPAITTPDVTVAYEDSLYLVDYNASDIDLQKETMTWTMVTNATWLHLNSTSGMLSGTPSNADVGWYDVSITVDDGRGGQDSRAFILAVLNVNDPVIETPPVLYAKIGKIYFYNVSTTDIDVGDMLAYFIARGPAGMSIDASTGRIAWTPVAGQEGPQEVIVRVSDPHVSVEQSYIIQVEPVLSVMITSPAHGQKVSGLLKVAGTAQGPSNMTIEVDQDGTGWTKVEGNRNWTYTIETKRMSKGEHTIAVRASWGQYRSKEEIVTFKKVDKTQTSVADWYLAVLFLILILVSTVLLLYRERKEMEREKKRRARKGKKGQG
jgi:hypothetical protein